MPYVLVSAKSIDASEVCVAGSLHLRTSYGNLEDLLNDFVCDWRQNEKRKSAMGNTYTVECAPHAMLDRFEENGFHVRFVLWKDLKYFCSFSSFRLRLLKE